MRELLNDFISLIFGKKQYSTLELSVAYGVLIFILTVLFIVKDRLI